MRINNMIFSVLCTMFVVISRSSIFIFINYISTLILLSSWYIPPTWNLTLDLHFLMKLTNSVWNIPHWLLNCGVMCWRNCILRWFLLVGLPLTLNLFRRFKLVLSLVRALLFQRECLSSFTFIPTFVRILLLGFHLFINLIQ